MQRVKLALVCLSWLYLASAVSAQTAVDPTTDAGIAAVQNFSGGGVLQGTYFDIRHVIGDGVGYQNSYSQIGAFTPFWLNEDAFIAPNNRVTITNSTQTGYNFGAVARQYLNGPDRIIGAYGYYDNDQDALNYRYAQYTVGAETLGTWWDLRGNAYILNGMNSNFIKALGVGGNPFYVGNNIAFTGQQLRDQSLNGLDVEFGVPVSPYAQWLRAYSGAYGYRTGNGNTIGYRGRIEAMVSNDLTLGVTVSQDALYGTNVNGTIDFKFSGFQPTRYFPNLTTKQRMLNPVQRNWRIATHSYVQAVDVAAINPSTNQPYFITHVNNAAPAGGNGTIEHPYHDLTTSSQADIILVHGGNATTPVNPVTGSAVLSNNQRLLGDGLLSTVLLQAHYGANTIFGTYNLPQTQNTGIFPYVTNPAGNIVTLANNNEVAGLNLVNATGTAINNSATGSNNFNLHNLEIAGNQGGGISLTNASGIGILSNINTGTDNHPNPLGLGSNAAGGVQIATGSPGLNLQLYNLYMNATPAAPQAFGLSLAANNGFLNVNMNNVFTSGNGSGIRLSESSQLVNANMNLVRANNNAGAGIAVQGTGGAITITGNDVAASNNAGDNLQIGTKASPIVTSTVLVSLNNAFFTNSTGGSGIVFSQSGGTGTLNLLGDQTTGLGSVVTGNAVDGLAIYGTGLTVMNANVQNGMFQNNSRDAFHVEAISGSTVGLMVDPTNASNSGRDGLYYNIGLNSTFNATLLSTNFNNSGQSAMNGLLTNFATLNLFSDNSTGANSGGNGFFLSATNNASANVEVDHGTFANSGTTIAGSSAINVFSDHSMVNMLTNLTLANNANTLGAKGSQAYGLTLNLQNNSNFSGTYENGGNTDGTGMVGFSDSLVNAINANVNSGSNANLTLFNMIGDRSGADGFVANVNNASLTANVTNGSFSRSGNHGVNFNVTNSGLLTTNFNNTAINANGAAGIDGTVSGTNSQANFNMLSTNVNNNINSGLDFYATGNGTINVFDRTASISNNGSGGAFGNGVVGVVTTGGVANLDFENITINNNLDNGVFLTANTGGNVNTKFALGTVNGNGLRSPVPLHHNDGIRLALDNATNSSLQIVNNAQVSGNGSDGVAIVAANSTNVVGVIDTASIVNNGAAGPFSVVQNGAGVEAVAESNSVVGLLFHGVSLNNTLPNQTQNYGFLSTSVSGAQLTASFETVDLSNHAIDAFNTTVLSGSTTNINLDHSTADNSKATGALFDVTTGGTLNFISTLNSSISNSGGTGIFAVVDGAGSVANFDLTSLSLNVNGVFFGGQGFNGQATNGGNLNAVLTNTSVQRNSNQGIELTAAGANSVVNFHAGNSTVDFNNSQGLLINVSDLAQVNYRSDGTTYNSNGASGNLDGVTVNVTGNGPLDSATALLLFANSSIDSNKANGLTLNATNGATLTTSIINMDISNNAGFGIMSTATGANTKFNLLMSGTNTITGNGLGSINPLVFNGLNQVLLNLAGNFNGSTGDGLHIDLQNIINAQVAVQGPGTINNSTLNGLNINMANITNGSVLLNGISTITSSGLDGVKISMNNIANGAVAIQGPTTISSSGADGIDIALTNTHLVDGLSFGAAHFKVLTLGDNLASPLNNRLPIPVDFLLNNTGLVPATALTINGVVVSSSANTGINILATGSTIETMSITGNSIQGATGTAVGTGDGIHLDLTNTPVTTLNFNYNTVGGAKLNSVNFDLNNSPITTVGIYNNSIGIGNGSGSTVGDTLPLIVPGFTANSLPAVDDFPSVLANLGFNANFYGVMANQVFVNNNGNVTFGSPLSAFTPFSLLSTSTKMIAPFFADVDTRTGPVVTYGTSTIAGHAAFGVDWLGVNHFNQLGPANTFQLVMIDRSDIAPGDFDFEFNYQSILWEAGTASGSNNLGLGGSSARAGYTNGSTVGFELPGSAVNGALLDGGPAGTSLIHNDLNSSNLGRYIFTVRNGVVGGVSPSGLDGIRLNATNGSNIGSFVAANNEIANSGTNGIELLLNNSNLKSPQFLNNNIHDNGGDGIRLVNPITPDTKIITNFVGNTITTNGGTGINLSLVNGTQNLDASFASNTISSNKGLAGINIQLADNRNSTGGFDSNKINLNTGPGVNFKMGQNGVVTSDFTNNTINQNSAQGINFNMGLNGVINTNIQNNTINGNTAEGINIALQTGGKFNDPTFYGNTIGTTASPNGSLGVRLTVPDQASFVWNLGDSTKNANVITGNSGAGVGINMTDASTGTLTVQNSTFSNTKVGADPTFSGQGLGIFMNNTATLNNATIGSLNAVNSTATNNTTFTNNAGAGLSIVGNGNAQMQNLLITNINSTNNTGDGIDISRIGSPVFSNTTIQNSQINGNAIGISLLASNSLLTDSYTIRNNQINQNTSDGLRIDVRFDAQILANLTSNTFNLNGGDGIRVQERQNASTDNRLVSGTWTLNTITNNRQNGIEITAKNNLNIGASPTRIDNVITGNTLDGILIQGVNAQSNTTIQGNVISQNLSNGITVNGTANFVTINGDMIWQNSGDGVQLFGRNGGGLIASIDDSTIRFNSGDGVKIASSGQRNSGAPFSVTIGTNNLNEISDNAGHGINVLNQANGNASIDIENNNINRNGLEGVYVVNTASATQGQNSTIAVNSDGNVFDNSQMKFVFNNNSVMDDGHSALGANFSDTTGLYIRVGTNGASTSVTDPGGFASNASVGQSISTATLSGRGGVLALVTNNTFGGNAGHDVAFESFTSTQPSATGGAANWTDQNDNVPGPDTTLDIFNPAGYQTDPLARLDLRFTGNVGQDASVTRSGAFYGGAANADPIWKSRVSGPPATVSPGGPFPIADAGARLRNAQRLASNAAPFNAPAFPSVGSNFLYPGVGSSTFRVSSNSDFSNGANANTNSFGSVNPGGFNGAVGLGVLFGEQSFNWTTNIAP